MIYLDPKNDLTFKKIFGEHKDLLKSLLNALLPFEKEREVVELEYLSPEQTPQNPLGKNSIVDVKCKDNQGRIFIVEMQLYWTNSFKSRVLFNTGKAYIKQAEPMQKYESLQPVYSLNLINDIYKPEDENFYHHYQIVEVGDPQERLEGMEFIFIELPKFHPDTLSDKKLMVLWLRFLTEIRGEHESISQDFNQEKDIQKALDLLKKSSYSSKELDAYEKFWDEIAKEQAFGYDKYQEGIEKGLKKGIEEGERRATIKIARQMLESGVSKEMVAQATKLSIEELNKLKL